MSRGGEKGGDRADARARFDRFCESLAELRVDRSGGLVKPYKPIMVAAVVILVHKGKITSRNVFLDGGLRSAFLQLLAALYPRWPTAAKPDYPFRHLENDGVWQLVPLEGASEALRHAKAARAEAWDVLKHVRCAQLDEAVFDRLAGDFQARFKVLKILAQRYFPSETSARLWDYLGDAEEPLPPLKVAEGEALTERAVEEHIERHWDETPFARLGVALSRPDVNGFAGRQVFTPVNAIDLLGWRADRKEWWVIELKRGRPPDSVVGQVSRYLGWIQAQRSGRGESAVGAIIARRSDPKLRYAVEANPRLSLWLFDERLELRKVA